jgi:tetratricopeptide (TPR) repeat protein
MLAGHLSALMLAFAGLIWPGTASADEAAAAAAREHFEHGYALAQSGSFEAAIEEFELAYAASPNFSVLFNLGQAYGASGRAVKAAHTLERYLELGGTAIDSGQRRRSEELIHYYQRRIGQLTPNGLPRGAVLSLDGEEQGSAPFAAPLEASAGSHALSVSAVGYQSSSEVVHVRAGEVVNVDVKLRPEAAASLFVTCDIPEVDVRVDDVHVATTPVATALRVQVGAHRVSLSRPGYASLHYSLAWSSGQAQRLTCPLRIDAPAGELAHLRALHPRSTQVFVDGQPFRGEGLPAGVHVMAVAGQGFDPETRRIELTARQTLSVSLIPRAAGALLDQARQRHEKTQKIAAYAVGGGAVLLGGAAITVAAINASRYASWRKKDEAFTSSFERDPSSTNLAQLEDLLTEENAIRNVDSLALGMGVAAATLAVTSVALYLTAGNGAPTLTVTPKGEATLGYVTAF